MGFMDKIKNVFKPTEKSNESPDDNEIIEKSVEKKDEFQYGEPVIVKQTDDKPTPSGKIANFKYLDDLIQNGSDEIILDCDIILEPQEERQYMDGINIDSKSLVIDGNGHSIDACGKTRIFYCEYGNITLKNITLKNGFSKDRGGAIYNYVADLNIFESHLSGNVSELYGGAIYNNASCKLRIVKSQFTNNTAENNGGAIYNRGKVILEDDLFEKNSSMDDNGDIFSSGKIFFSKDSSGYEDKINNEGTFHEFKHLTEGQRDFTYLNNLIENGTGEIMLEHDVVVDVVNGDESTFYDGIEIENETLTIDGNGHSVDGQGLIRIFKIKAKSMTLKNITLKNGFSDNDGGAIYNDKCELTIENSILSENRTKGSAIFNNQGTVNITDSKVSRNVSTSKSVKDVAAIHNYRGELNANRSVFFENHSDDGSMSVIVNELGSVNINQSKFSNNSLLEKIITTEGHCEIYNSEFSNNNASEYIINNRESLTLSNVIFKNNRSGVLLNNKGYYSRNNMNVVKSKFEDNDIDESVIIHSSKYCTIEECVFDNNLSHNANSRNIINRAHLTLNNSDIKEEGKTILNENYIILKKSPQSFLAKIEGDGEVESDILPDENRFDFGFLDKMIHESETNEIVLNEDILFEPYEIDFYEGGIELDIDDLVIDGNGKTIDGGGKSRIFIISGKNITLKNITFKNGKCFSNEIHNINNNGGNNNGGALRVYSTAEGLSISRCKFMNNSTNENGGAIDAYRLIGLHIHDCEFKDNVAGTFGGAISQYKSESYISDSSFSSNRGAFGGAINDYNGKLSVSNTEIFSNSSQFGAAIYLRWSNIVMNDSKIHDNSVKREGHTIFNVKSELDIDDSCYMDWTVATSSMDPYAFQYL